MRAAVTSRHAWAAPALLALAGACAATSKEAAAPAGAAPYEGWEGRRIVSEAVARHQQFPYVYEEQTMVLMDASQERTVRRLRRFSRAEADGSFKLLLVFDDPEVIRGVTLLAVRRPDGSIDNGVFLPAFRRELKRPRGEGTGGNFLGTDLTVEDLAAEDVERYRYVRGWDTRIEDVDYFVVDAFPRDIEVERQRGYGLRRHLIRKDNFVIEQTDFFDRRLRLLKRLTRHDLRRVDGPSWRANMIIVSDERDQHQTLLKVNRRIYSRDYVPREIFEPEHILSGNVTAPRQPEAMR